MSSHHGFLEIQPQKGEWGQAAVLDSEQGWRAGVTPSRQEWLVVSGSCSPQERRAHTTQPSDVGKGCSSDCREVSGLVTPWVSGRDAGLGGASPAETWRNTDTHGGSCGDDGGAQPSAVRMPRPEHTAGMTQRGWAGTRLGSASFQGVTSVSAGPLLKTGRITSCFLRAAAVSSVSRWRSCRHQRGDILIF